MLFELISTPAKAQLEPPSIYAISPRLPSDTRSSQKPWSPKWTDGVSNSTSTRATRSRKSATVRTNAWLSTLGVSISVSTPKHAGNHKPLFDQLYVCVFDDLAPS